VQISLVDHRSTLLEGMQVGYGQFLYLMPCKLYLYYYGKDKVNWWPLFFVPLFYFYFIAHGRKLDYWLLVVVLLMDFMYFCQLQLLKLCSESTVSRMQRRWTKEDSSRHHGNENGRLDLSKVII
jgi:hypothetical protein